MNPIALLLALACLGVALVLFLVFEIAIFRLACGLSGVPRPATGHSFLVVGILLIAPGIIDGFGYAILHAIYRASRYPLWEADVVQFFLAVPFHMAICSFIHSKLMRVPVGDALGVWFVEKLLKLGVISLAAGLVGIALLVGRFK